MRLNEIQTRFKDLMLEPHAPDENLGQVFASGDTPLSERLKIYRNNFMGNVSGAMMNSFPLLEKLVGRDFLMAMNRAFILASPPESGCLTSYGLNYDKFIETYEPAKGLPYLADMARLEIAINAAYHACDDKALTADELAAIPPDKLAMFELKPRDSAQLVRSAYPLTAIRDLCLSGEDKVLDIYSGGVFLMVHRPFLEVQITALSESEYVFLGKLENRPLGQSVAETLEIYPDFDFQKALPRFMNLEAFLKTEKS